MIGPSASGKSTLARVLTGIWRPASGAVRLDGAALDQYEPDVLGRYIGYLPQDVVLFDGTVAENIARHATDAEPRRRWWPRRKKAGAHEMILDLPQGYDTPVSAGGARLSGGQKQRIGLARAFYGDPVLLVLDEPNSNLDAAGQDALNLAIRQAKAEGKAVVIMAHRPAGIAECDLILIIDGGVAKAFGPRDEVLKAHVRNYAPVAGRIAPEEASSDRRQHTDRRGPLEHAAGSCSSATRRCFTWSFGLGAWGAVTTHLRRGGRRRRARGRGQPAGGPAPQRRGDRGDPRPRRRRGRGRATCWSSSRATTRAPSSASSRASGSRSSPARAGSPPSATCSTRSSSTPSWSTRARTTPRSPS